MGSSRSHWEDVYAAKAETAVSWYQRHAVQSLQMIAAAAPGRTVPVIDIGGGASTLVDDLLAEGFGDITVLDVAEAALAKSKARLGAAENKVSWIVADITQWKPPRHYRVWHDRAVFHFLTETPRQDAYIAALEAATEPAATAILGLMPLLVLRLHGTEIERPLAIVMLSHASVATSATGRPAAPRRNLSPPRPTIPRCGSAAG